MKYLKRFLAGTDRNDGNPPPAEVDAWEMTVEKSRHSSKRVPTETTKTVSADAWPPRPADLARWPIPWRERWGKLSNELEELGMKFPGFRAASLYLGFSRDGTAARFVGRPVASCGGTRPIHSGTSRGGISHGGDDTTGAFPGDRD